MTKSSLILPSSLVTAAILLTAASILPPSVSEAAQTTSFTVKGNTLEEIENQVREELEGLGLSSQQEEEVVNQIEDEITIPEDGDEVVFSFDFTCTFNPPFEFLAPISCVIVFCNPDRTECLIVEI